MQNLNGKKVTVLETSQGKRGICAYISLDGATAQWYTTSVFLDLFGLDLAGFLAGEKASKDLEAAIWELLENDSIESISFLKKRKLISVKFIDSIHPRRVHFHNLESIKDFL